MFLGILFLVLVVFCLVFYFFRGQMGAQVKVTVDGALYGTYPLEKEQEIAIEKDGVVTNRLVIRDGVAGKSKFYPWNTKIKGDQTLHITADQCQCQKYSQICHLISQHCPTHFLHFR